LRVAVSDGRGRAVRDGGLGRWLQRVAPRGARGEVSIALVSNARMRILNQNYRHKDYATDVLSFPATPTPTGPRTLGDLVIATGVARRQAREAGHSYQTELRVLALHGLLHLLGYDHEAASDRGRMKRAEARLRRKGGLTRGLIARAEGRLKPAPTKDRAQVGARFSGHTGADSR
jgi:probable rRNA maturation factor